MKAFILDRYGSADGVRAGEMPGPQPQEHEVLVQVHAAGVNLLDSRNPCACSNPVGSSFLSQARPMLRLREARVRHGYCE
jgi:hypothetical protein